MVKPEWGTKRICQSCGARFYDLQRSPIQCPACGAAYDLEQAGRSKRSRPAHPAKPPVAAAAIKAKKVALDEEVEFDEEEVGAESEEEDESGSPIEDASELGEDDMSDVIEVEDEDEER